jgi:hypothetical protein
MFVEEWWFMCMAHVPYPEEALNELADVFIQAQKPTTLLKWAGGLLVAVRCFFRSTLSES